MFTDPLRPVITRASACFWYDDALAEIIFIAGER
jgi:hypothetical protein